MPPRETTNREGKRLQTGVLVASLVGARGVDLGSIALWLGH
jgi:hypothetical protein